MDNRLYSFIGLIQKSGKLSSGDDTVEFDVKRKKSRLIIIALDASENTKKKFENTSKTNNIPYVYLGEREQLGSYIGKSPRAVLSINDEGFAKAFLTKMKQFDGGASIVKS